MCWRTTVVCALGLVTMTGCPETHRRGGRLDRAAHKDARQGIDEKEGCTETVYNALCLGDEDSEECLEACGE